jgi:uncharacterized protein (TIGR02284 family)
MENETSTSILTLDRQTVDLVQDLIKVALDGSALFAEASRKVNDAGLAGLFKRLGRERAWMARDLQVLVEACDERPQRRGTMTGVVHRLWMDVRSAMNAGDPRVLVAEVERVEAKIAETCRIAVSQTASGPVHDWFVKRHAQVKRDLAQLRRRRDNRR